MTTDRTDKFMERVNAHLATLPEHKRRSFLANQLMQWEARYAEFQGGKTGPVTDKSDPPQASDFVLTINALAARLEQFKQEPVS